MKRGPRPNDTDDYTWIECPCGCHELGGMHIQACCNNGWKREAKWTFKQVAGAIVFNPIFECYQDGNKIHLIPKDWD